MILILMVLLFCQFLSAEADPLPCPDIRTETLAEFLSDDPTQGKLMRAAYLNSLDQELQRLSSEILLWFADCPELSSSFLAAHESFLDYAASQAGLSETSCWYHPISGEGYFGSGYGYQSISVSSMLVWERIRYYDRILEALHEQEFFGDQFGMVPDSSIGGH